jgi:hypothetical protein
MPAQMETSLEPSVTPRLHRAKPHDNWRGGYPFAPLYPMGYCPKVWTRRERLCHAMYFGTGPRSEFGRCQQGRAGPAFCSVARVAMRRAKCPNTPMGICQVQPGTMCRHSLRVGRRLGAPASSGWFALRRTRTVLPCPPSQARASDRYARPPALAMPLANRGDPVALAFGDRRAASRRSRPGARLLAGGEARLAPCDHRSPGQSDPACTLVSAGRRQGDARLRWWQARGPGPNTGDRGSCSAA